MNNKKLKININRLRIYQKISIHRQILHKSLNILEFQNLQPEIFLLAKLELDKNQRIVGNLKYKYKTREKLIILKNKYHKEQAGLLIKPKQWKDKIVCIIL